MELTRSRNVGTAGSIPVATAAEAAREAAPKNRRLLLSTVMCRYDSLYDSMTPQEQRRGKHLLSGLGTCGVCGGGWIRIKSGFWGCAGVRNGAGCTNTRQISDYRYESRVLTGLKDHLLDPEAVALYLEEYRANSIERDRTEGRTRGKLMRKIAEAERRLERLVEAIATGAQDFGLVKEKMIAARADRLALQEQLDAIESRNVIALHPKIVADYRREVLNLDALLKDDTPESREQVMPRIRLLIDTIILTPATVGRGVDIEMTGRLAKMIELATGRPVGDLGMLTLERVKGIEPSS